MATLDKIQSELNSKLPAHNHIHICKNRDKEIIGHKRRAWLT